MKNTRWLIPLFCGWLVFVVSLATWWMIFSLGLIQKFHEQNPLSHFEQQKTMLMTEGAVLIFFLLLGGLALIYFALREQKRLSEVKLFFSTFSHDLKTSIARLVLQGERLSQKYPEAQEFQKNLLILEMQLENSLHLAQMDQRGLVLENIDLKKIVARLHLQWPGLQIHLQGKAAFVADPVAVESIFKNLISNSLLHGQADEIFLKVSADSAVVAIEYADNSKTMINSVENLGLSLRPSDKGSGLGLYIVRRWMVMQKGSIEFCKSSTNSLMVKLQFPGVRGVS